MRISVRLLNPALSASCYSLTGSIFSFTILLSINLFQVVMTSSDSDHQQPFTVPQSPPGTITTIIQKELRDSRDVSDMNIIIKENNVSLPEDATELRRLYRSPRDISIRNDPYSRTYVGDEGMFGLCKYKFLLYFVLLFPYPIPMSLSLSLIHYLVIVPLHLHYPNVQLDFHSTWIGFTFYFPSSLFIHLKISSSFHKISLSILFNCVTMLTTL